MGFNTSILLLNDNLSELERDPEAGIKIARAVLSACLRDNIDVPMKGGNCLSTPITVVESHHADGNSVVMFGGNRAQILSKCVFKESKEGDLSPEVGYLRSLAAQHGYTLTKRRGGPRGW